jgi:hypothetical protein
MQSLYSSIEVTAEAGWGGYGRLVVFKCLMGWPLSIAWNIDAGFRGRNFGR